MVVGARQSFQFFRLKTWFLEIIDLCFNLYIGFCITWLVLPNFKKLAPKNQFQINYANHRNIFCSNISVLFFQTDLLELECQAYHVFFLYSLLQCAIHMNIIPMKSIGSKDDPVLWLNFLTFSWETIFQLLAIWIFAFVVV